MLVRIKQFGVLNDPEFASKMPSLDLLNDLRDANKLNSAQYDALLRFYKDPTAIQDDETLDLISGQLFIAETVEDLDRIQNNMNFSPEYLASIGIKDAVTMNNLIDKFKNDRQIFQDYKAYEKTINNIMGKVENTLIREFGPKEKADQALRHSAIRIYNEFIDEGLTPEEAFLKVSKGFMSNNDKVPTIYDVAEVSSIRIPAAAKIQKDQDPIIFFDGLRDKVMEEYKLGNIGIDELKRDIGSLDIMQDVFDIRKEIGDATGNPDFGFSAQTIQHLRQQDKWQRNWTTTIRRVWLYFWFLSANKEVEERYSSLFLLTRKNEIDPYEFLGKKLKELVLLKELQIKQNWRRQTKFSHQF